LSFDEFYVTQLLNVWLKFSRANATQGFGVEKLCLSWFDWKIAMMFVHLRDKTV